MRRRIPGQLRVQRDPDDGALAHAHDRLTSATVRGGDGHRCGDLDPFAPGGHLWRPDRRSAQRPRPAGRGTGPGRDRLDRVDLTPEGVAPHRNVEDAEAALTGCRGIDQAREENQPGTGAKGGQAAADGFGQRLAQTGDVEQPVEHRGLTPRNDQRVNGIELGAAPHGQRFGSGGAQRGEMLAGVALQREHTDACAHGRPGVKSRE